MKGQNMSSVVSIPDYSVHKIGKDRYAVAVTNGNMGACVLNRAQLEQLADEYGVTLKDEKSTAQKAAAGLSIAGVVAGGAAAILSRKNICNFVKGLNNGKAGEAAEIVGNKVSETASNLKTKAAEFAGKVKETAVNTAGNIKEQSGGWYAKSAEWLGKVWTTIKNFLTAGFNRVKKFFVKNDASKVH